MCMCVCVQVLLSLDREEPVAAASYEVLKEGTTSPFPLVLFFLHTQVSLFCLSQPEAEAGGSAADGWPAN